MLGKLMKYEWKATWKMILLMNLFTVIMTMLGCISLAVVNFADPTPAQMLFFMAVLVFYMLTVFAVSIGCTIFIAVRFYKNLYTDEGYLMHTLPVTPRQLIVSKLTVASGEYLFTSFLTGTSVLAMVGTAMAKISPVEYETFLEELFRFEDTMGMSVGSYTTMMMIMTVIGSITSALMIYASISIGQLASKYKVLASIGAYIAITTVMQIVGMIGGFVMMMNGAMWRGPAVQLTVFTPYQNFYIMMVVCTLLFGIACYAVTELIMKKKLNLD